LAELHDTPEMKRRAQRQTIQLVARHTDRMVA
jgi:hypothetical protein